MGERTPPDFTFDIKAHALLTGQPSETKRLPKEIREALPEELAAKPRIYARDLPRELRTSWSAVPRGLEPLARAASSARSCCSTRAGSSRRRRTATRSSRRGAAGDGLPVAVEFRHGTWFNEKNAERTLRFLTDQQIPLVVVDGPQGFKSSLPPVVAATSPDLAVVRFHGRRTRDLGGEGHPDGGAVPLPVRPRRARGMGAADRASRPTQAARRTC